MPGFPLRSVMWSFWRVLVAAALMGEVVWLVARNIGGNTGTDALLRVAVGSVAGAVVYLVLLFAMGAPELDAVRNWRQRRRSASTA